MWLWSESHRGIWKSLHFRTHFESNGSAEFHGGAFPVRPYSRAVARLHEIESEDYFRLVTGDYFQKPLSNWTSLSPGIQLYGT